MVSILPVVLVLTVLSSLVMSRSYSHHSYPIEIAQPIRINQNNGKGLESNIGIVYGTRTCGGPGTPAQWRFQGCHTTTSSCRIPADGTLLRSELDFTPSRDISQLGLRISVSIEGQEPVRIYERTFSDCSVIGGIQHTISGAARILPELRGRNLTTQHILYRVAGEIIEICVEADFIVV